MLVYNFNLGIICLLILGNLIILYIITSVHSWYRLRKIPGPFLTSFSYLWLARTIYSGKQHLVYLELNNKYGPLVRIGPNELLTDDPEIIKKTSSIHSLYKKDGWYLGATFNPYHDNLFTLLDRDMHTKARGKRAAAYSGRELPAFEDAVTSQVNELVGLLRQNYASTGTHSKQPLLNLGQVLSYLTMDVITFLAFGQEVGYLKNEFDHYNFLRESQAFLRSQSVVTAVPWIRNVVVSRFFFHVLGPKITDKTGVGALLAMAGHQVGKRFVPGAKQEHDMLGSFIRHGLDQKECEVEGLFMLIAGTETTTSALRSILTHIITCPRVYQRLKDEILLAVSQGRASNPILNEEAKRLPYLQAVVFEGMRIRPPGIPPIPKVVPAGGEIFHGKFIPAGTAICANFSSIMRSTALFGADTDVFKPERFMEIDQTKRNEMERNVELVFGYGQYMCLGKMLAFMEINKALFELLKAFDFQLIGPMDSRNSMSYTFFVDTKAFVKVTETAKVGLDE